MNLNEWINDVDGRVIGAGQCWDLAQDYSTRVTGGGSLGTSPSPHAGYAIGVWDGYGSNGVEQHYDQAPASAIMGAGWLPVWKFGTITAPLSHIAVGLTDIGVGVACMTQNPGGAHHMVIAKEGLAGYLVPKNGGTSAGIRLASDNTNSGGNPLDAISGFTNTVANIQHFFATPGIWQRIGLYAIGVFILFAAITFMLKDNIDDIVKEVAP